MYPKGIDNNGKRWRHEDGSVAMFNYLLECNKIDVREYGLNDRDKLFIEEIIGGVKEHDRHGREPNQFYMYDIVNNARSGLDVDKLDYFQRDMKMANVLLQTDFDRFIDLARVLPAEPLDDAPSDCCPASLPLMICYPEKMVPEAISVFAARYQMHNVVYTHKSVKEVEFMVCDILELANPYIRIEGSRTASHPEGLYRISECIYDMMAFSRLRDSVLDIIQHTRDPGLEQAKALMARLARRELYSCVGKTSYSDGDNVDCLSEEDILCDIETIARELAALPPSPLHQQEPVVLRAEDIIVEKMHVHHGLKGRNPVDRLRFFPKAPSSSSFLAARRVPEVTYENVLPRVFEARAVRLFCRSSAASVQLAARRAFEEWCRRVESHSPFPSLSQQSQ